jgi:acetyltransferase-like isoleucine patch superfamily enzyme
MKKTIIIGTGAVAAELTQYIIDNNKFVNIEFQKEIIGYIEYDYNIEKYWKKYKFEKPILGDIDNYTFDHKIEVLIGVSDISFRNKIISKLATKNAKIGQFIHNSVIIPENTKLGNGNIIYPFCIIGPNCEVGNFNLITSYSCISHDSIIGDGNFLSTVAVAGRVLIGNNNFFGIRSTVLPNIVIGNDNVIQAGMIVDKSITCDSTVFYKYKEKILAVPK